MVTDAALLKGKVVIDPTNAIAFPHFKPIDLGDKTSSEVISELLPGARLVKAFNTLPAAVLAANPEEANGRRVAFVSGNDKQAKATVKQIISRLRFAAIDLGKLETGGKLQQFGGPLPALNLVRVVR